jgi:hypothetical protein
MQTEDMRTTVTLDEKTHAYASYYARVHGLSLGEALDALVEKAQAAPVPAPEIEFGPNNFPMFPRSGRVLTTEMVRKLERELEEEEIAQKNPA